MVDNEKAKSGPYGGDGSNKKFYFYFRALDDAHVTVYKGNDVVPKSAYSVTRGDVVDPESSKTVDGGYITFATAPVSGAQVSILRDVPVTQEVQLENNDTFYPKVIENEFDKLTMITQQLSEAVGRCYKVGPHESSSGSMEELTSLPPRVTALESGAVVSAGAIQSNTNRINALSGSVTSLNGSVTSLDNRVSSIESGGGGNLGARVSALESWTMSSPHGVVFSSAGLEVSSGAFYSSMTITGDTDVYVYSGGLINYVDVTSMGTIYVMGGTVNRMDISSDRACCYQQAGYVGSAYVYGDSTAIIRDVSTPDGGHYFLGGGTLNSATVSGHLRVWHNSAGSDTDPNTVINGVVISGSCGSSEWNGMGGVVQVLSDASISNVTLAGGAILCVSGGTVREVNYLSGAYISGGTRYDNKNFMSGGTVIALTQDPILGAATAGGGGGELESRVNALSNTVNNVTSGNTALYTTVSGMGGTVSTLSSVVNDATSGNSALHSAAEWTSERIDDADGAIRELQNWQETVSGNVDKIPNISATANAASIVVNNATSGNAALYNSISRLGSTTVIPYGSTHTVASGNLLSNVVINGGTLSVASGGSACQIRYEWGVYESAGRVVYQEYTPMMVTVSGGTVSGSLYDALVNTSSEFIVFDPAVSSFDLEGGTIGRSVNLIGNGAANTIVTTSGGTMSVVSGATVRVSQLTMSGGLVSSGATLACDYGVLAGTVNNYGTINLADTAEVNGSLVMHSGSVMPIPSLLTGSGSITYDIATNINVNGGEISGLTITGVFFRAKSGTTVIRLAKLYRGSSSYPLGLDGGNVEITGTVVTDCAFSTGGSGTITLKSDCIFDVRNISTSYAVYGNAGTNRLIVESGAQIVPFGQTQAVTLTAGTFSTLGRDGTLA